MDVEGGRRNAKRGVKRQADESNLSEDQRFAKRFNLLDLNSNDSHSNTYLPVQSSAYAAESATNPVNDGMQVDDTKDRVYVGDLDAEIADIEKYEPKERLIFLPDIEKHFSRIPHSVLVGGDKGADKAEDQQLILYDIPKSLSDDRGHESVRKAILEARRRAQEQATARARTDLGNVDIGTQEDYNDVDAMDIG